MTVVLLCIVVAIVLFLLSAVNTSSRVNLVSAGLAACTLALLAYLYRGGLP